MSPPAVALVFVATDENYELRLALESLDRDPPRHPLQIVVVDNASTDGVVQETRARFPEVTLLSNDWRRGLPANLNTGIRGSSAPFVLLCNPDLEFQPGSVDALADFLEEHPRAGMAAPKLLSPEGEVRPSARRWYTVEALLKLKLATSDEEQPPAVARSVYADWDYREPREVDWVPCPATMVRRSALHEVGLMDERFRLYFDDVDISLRMHLAGWEVWCVPGAEVVHFERRDSVQVFSRQWRWHLASLGKFAWKHKGLGPPGVTRA